MRQFLRFRKHGLAVAYEKEFRSVRLETLQCFMTQASAPRAVLGKRSWNSRCHRERQRVRQFLRFRKHGLAVAYEK
ncbi:MAG: hypothetical protein ACI4L8_02090, partial [Candidatus Fimadaptatus sp.]